MNNTLFQCLGEKYVFVSMSPLFLAFRLFVLFHKKIIMRKY